MATAVCPACGDDVLWLRHHLNGRSVAVEAKASPDGTVIVDLDEGTWRPLSAAQLAVWPGPLHQLHAERCAAPVAALRRPWPPGKRTVA